MGTPILSSSLPTFLSHSLPPSLPLSFHLLLDHHSILLAHHSVLVGSGQRTRGSGQRKKGFWAEKEGVWAKKDWGLGKGRGGSGQRKMGVWAKNDLTSAPSLGRAQHVMRRRVQSVLRRRGAVEDVARLEETGGDRERPEAGWAGAGRGLGAAGGAGRQGRAGPGRAGGGESGGRAGVLGTSGMCTKTCKRFGVKNARG